MVTLPPDALWFKVLMVVVDDPSVILAADPVPSVISTLDAELLVMDLDPELSRVTLV